MKFKKMISYLLILYKNAAPVYFPERQGNICSTLLLKKISISDLYTIYTPPKIFVLQSPLTFPYLALTFNISATRPCRMRNLAWKYVIATIKTNIHSKANR